MCDNFENPNCITESVSIIIKIFTYYYQSMGSLFSTESTPPSIIPEINKRMCKSCNGSGRRMAPVYVPCPCDKSSKGDQPRYDPNSAISGRRCFVCNGTGKILQFVQTKEPCDSCHGKGFI